VEKIVEYRAIATAGTTVEVDGALIILNTRHKLGRGDKFVFVTPLDQEASDHLIGWPGGKLSRTTPASRKKAKKLIGRVRREAVASLWGAVPELCPGIHYGVRLRGEAVVGS